MLKSMTFRSTLAAVACAISLSAYARADSPRQIDIPAGELPRALLQLSKQYGADLVYRPEQVHGLKTQGAHGNLTSEQAVTKLLQGTQLKVTTDAIGAMIIAAPGTAEPKAGADSKEGARSKTFWDGFRLAQVDQGKAASTIAGGDGESNLPKDSKLHAELQEVVVTAQKRAENQKNVPISISVVTGRQLDATTGADLNDVLNRVPGVTTIGSSGFSQLSVRGVTGSASFEGASPIAYYIDSVPFNLIKSGPIPDTNPYDLNRVEVLRGPQGTLYGASALNGVVRVLTNDADLNKFEFKARVSGSDTESGGGNYRGDAALNVPLIQEKLGIRMVAGVADWTGWIDKPNTGEKDANDQHITNLRVKVNAQPTEDLSAGLSAWRSRDHGAAPSTSQGGQRNVDSLREPWSADYDAYGLTLAYDFSGAALTSWTSYLDYQSNQIVAFLTYTVPFQQGARISSEEINLHSKDGGEWRWSLGAMFRNGQDTLFSGIYSGDTALVQYHFVDRSQSYAAYGEVSRLFDEGKFELTGGARYFHDKVTSREFDVNGATTLETESKFHPITYRGVLTWHATDDSMLYASYSEGFRSGFDQYGATLQALPNAPTVRPDTLNNYELGTKGSVWNARLRYETAVYYMDWRNVQQSLTIVNPVTGVVIGTQVNGSSASGLGVDLAVTALPLDKLELGVTFSWNDLTLDRATVTSVSATEAIILFNKGERRADSPEYRCICRLHVPSRAPESPRGRFGVRELYF